MSYVTNIESGMLYIQDGDKWKEVGCLRDVRLENVGEKHNTNMRFLNEAEVSFRLGDGGKIPEVDWEVIDRIIAWMNANHVIKIAFDGEKWVGFKENEPILFDDNPGMGTLPWWKK